MHAPGVEVRPLRQMNGDAHFSEVFLDGALVPDTDRIGDVGAGWAVARTALANERGAIGAASAGGGCRLDRLLDLARRPARRWRRRPACAATGSCACYVEVEVARLTGRRARDAARAGRAPGPEGSGLKLRGSATLKSTAGAALGRRSGAEAVLGGGEWQTLFLTAPSISIRGGTDEIQRNIVGERVLGSPARAPRRRRPSLERDPALSIY